jgi:tetraacyldisaccharide 4'-kinase
MFSGKGTLEILSGRRGGIAAACLRGLLAAGEPLYRWYARRRNRGYDTGRLPITRVDTTVISVGNLTVGGTGKTPFVCWLAQWLQSRAVGVTLISRGYGRGGGQLNDEALELAARLPGVPHLQNADRVAAARQALAVNPRQVLILDDAFQHRRIARELDIVLVDALEPFGFGRLLPRGLLREPIEGLSRAQVVGLSRADAVSAARREEIHREVARVAPQATWIELSHRPAALINSDGQTAALDTLRGQKVLAFCGIGNPAGFAHTLESAGLNVLTLREFPDHHRYSERDLSDLDQWTASAPQAAAAVCTHKDLVKIPRDKLGQLPLWAVTVEIVISSAMAELERRLEEISAGMAVSASGTVASRKEAESSHRSARI